MNTYTAQTLEEYFDESDQSKLKELSGPFILNLRKKLQLTAIQFQSLLQAISNGGLCIDPSKHSRWEHSKALPDMPTQRAILRVNRSLAFGDLHFRDLELDLPLFMVHIRELVLDGNLDAANEWAKRESDNGVLSPENYDSDVWALLMLYRALIARMYGDKIEASDHGDDAASMAVSNKELKKLIEQNSIGFTFDSISERSLSSEDEALMLSELAERQRQMIRNNPKQNSWRKNILRIYSRLDEEKKFNDVFDELRIKIGDDEIASMLSRDEDNDFENALKYDSIKSFNSDRGNASSLCLSVLCLGVIATLLIGSISNTAEASDFGKTGGNLATVQVQEMWEASVAQDPLASARVVTMRYTDDLVQQGIDENYTEAEDLNWGVAQDPLAVASAVAMRYTDGQVQQGIDENYTEAEDLNWGVDQDSLVATGAEDLNWEDLQDRIVSGVAKKLSEASGIKVKTPDTQAGSLEEKSEAFQAAMTNSIHVYKGWDYDIASLAFEYTDDTIQ